MMMTKNQTLNMTKLMTTIRTYLIRPAFPLSIHVIGCGGTGSHFIMLLARMMWAYNKIYERRRVSVVLWDGDTVSETNISRQSFIPDELHLNKAEALVTRYNQMYGFEWIAKPDYFSEREFAKMGPANIYISFVDKVNARKAINKCFKSKQEFKSLDDYENAMLMWIDAGNSSNKSNVFCSLYGQYTIIDKYPNLKDLPDAPSCSTAEALTQQNLFINVFTADIAASILWDAIYEAKSLPNIVYFNSQFLNIKRVYEYSNQA